MNYWTHILYSITNATKTHSRETNMPLTSSRNVSILHFIESFIILLTGQISGIVWLTTLCYVILLINLNLVLINSGSTEILCTIIKLKFTELEAEVYIIRIIAWKGEGEDRSWRTAPFLSVHRYYRLSQSHIWADTSRFWVSSLNLLWCCHILLNLVLCLWLDVVLWMQNLVKTLRCLQELQKCIHRRAFIAEHTVHYCRYLFLISSIYSARLMSLQTNNYTSKQPTHHMVSLWNCVCDYSYE